MKGIGMDALKEVVAKEGEVIVSEGEEESKNVFFIEEGECEVLKENGLIIFAFYFYKESLGN